MQNVSAHWDRVPDKRSNAVKTSVFLQLYFHHVVPNPRFLLGEGAEVRGSTLRKPLTAPYGYIVNGTEAAELDTR